MGKGVMRGKRSYFCFTNNKFRHVKLYTSTITLRAVSAPRLLSVPGTLLLMVAGITTMGIQKALCFSRLSISSRALWYA